ncbi:MAG: hypothetical protein RLZZ227_35 [Pseudomonadota bacterium]|jgi:hypothetical protein
MRKALPQMLDLSRLLIAYEAGATQSADPDKAAADVCDRLRPKLSALMGVTGFRALLSRALAIAASETPSISHLEIDTRGALVYRAALSGTSSENGVEGGVAIVAHLLSLLVAFIGEQLTRQIVFEIWPQSLARDSNFRTGDSA